MRDIIIDDCFIWVWLNVRAENSQLSDAGSNPATRLLCVRSRSMGLFINSTNDENFDYDYERLRNDLMDEYSAQMAALSGAIGYVDMCDAHDASDEELLEMARREGFNLKKYRR